MPPNHYSCTGKHSEFTCLSAYYHNRRFVRDRWCQTCKDRYPERMGTNAQETA